MRTRRSSSVFTLLLLAGCSHTSHVKQSHLDQTSPTAALLSFFQAIQDGDAAAARQCVVVSPKYDRLVQHTLETYAAHAIVHHAVESQFPGQDKGIFLDTFTDASLAEVKEYITHTPPIVDGERAVFPPAPREENQTSRLIHQPWELRNLQGKWKLDFFASSMRDEAKLAGYPPSKGKDNDTGLAMIFLLHEFAPGLRQIARDIDNGKLRSIEQVKKAAAQVASEANIRANAKMEQSAAAQAGGGRK